MPEACLLRNGSGSCACATCHIHVDDSFVEHLPPAGADARALLDCSGHRRATSRLACQIRFSEVLDGLGVTIAPGE